MARQLESRSLVTRLGDARRQVQLLSREIREKTGVTATQAQVLCALLNSEGGSQTILVSKTGIDRSTLADVVRRLLKRGLIARKRTKEDQRAYAVRLTPEGRALAEKVCKTT